MPEFDAWAPYYDFIHHGLPGEVEFYVKMAKEHGSRALEVGCGTGRICIPMAKAGVAVTALDISSSMLALCQEKIAMAGFLPAEIELVRADMRRFDLDSTYPFIAMAYRTLMHLLTPDDQAQCLRCIRRHLEPGGVFACNLWMAKPSSIPPAAITDVEVPLELVGQHPVPGENIVLFHFHAARYDEFDQQIIEQHRIQERDLRGHILRQQELHLTRAWLTRREMEHLVYRCGFRVEAIYGNFDRAPLGPDHKEMIWVLRAV